MPDTAVYSGLFLISFLAATILPAQSEAGLVGLILSNKYSNITLVTFASVGNVMGAVVNWFLGTQVERFKERSWFPVKPKKLDKAARWYHKYGRWSLLLSWVPIVGDPLTIAAGVLKEPFWSFVLLVGIAKTTRYAVLTSIVLGHV